MVTCICTQGMVRVGETCVCIMEVVGIYACICDVAAAATCTCDMVGTLIRVCGEVEEEEICRRAIKQG